MMSLIAHSTLQQTPRVPNTLQPISSRQCKFPALRGHTFELTAARSRAANPPEMYTAGIKNQMSSSPEKERSSADTLRTGLARADSYSHRPSDASARAMPPVCVAEPGVSPRRYYHGRGMHGQPQRTMNFVHHITHHASACVPISNPVSSMFALHYTRASNEGARRPQHCASLT